MKYNSDKKLSMEEMKIAFRYQNLPDLSQDVYVLDFKQPIFSKDFGPEFSNFKCRTGLLSSLLGDLKEYESNNSPLLIVVHNCSSIKGPFEPDYLPQLMYLLKCFSRCVNWLSIVITYDPLKVSKDIRRLIHNASDNIVQMISFDKLLGSAYSDYQGTIKVHKLSNLSKAMNSGAYHTSDIGFSFKRNRYFIIERLSLPPDTGDTPSRSAPSAIDKSF